MHGLGNPHAVIFVDDIDKAPLTTLGTKIEHHEAFPDGVKCGIIICYDVRFPELTRSLALQGSDMLFVVSRCPKERIFHLQTFTVARAIENQIFVVCCNSCGTAGKTVYGGNSAIIEPFGKTLVLAGENEEILTAECDLQILSDIRGSIPVSRDRRPELY